MVMDTNPTPSSAAVSGTPPEKYIRTFGNDMSIFQKGGTPGLAPLEKVGPLPAERLVASSPLPPTGVSAPVLTPTPVLEPVAPPAPVVPEGPTPIKTYSEDFRERIKETRASTASILAAEQDAEKRPSIVVVSEGVVRDSHTVWYIVAGAALLVFGSVGVFFAYSSFVAPNVPVVIAPTAPAPIFVDSSEPISGTGTALAQAITQSAGKSAAANSIKLLSYSTAGTSVFQALNLHAPGQLLRNIVATGSMAGIVSVSSGNAPRVQSPFFILSVTSYSTTFSGMLSWEPTMQGDFGTLYPLYSSSIGGTSIATTTATSTPAAPVTPSPRGGFRDEVVSNHDVRVYRDAAGRSIMLYGYWNQSTLVIARDPDAFAQILGRLATSHS